MDIFDLEDNESNLITTGTGFTIEISTIVLIDLNPPVNTSTSSATNPNLVVLSSVDITNPPVAIATTLTPKPTIGLLTPVDTADTPVTTAKASAPKPTILVLSPVDITNPLVTTSNTQTHNPSIGLLTPVEVIGNTVSTSSVTLDPEYAVTGVYIVSGVSHSSTSSITPTIFMYERIPIIGFTIGYSPLAEASTTGYNSSEVTVEYVENTI